MQAFRDGSSSVADFCLRERQSRNVVARFSASACVGGSLICYVNVTRDAGVHERPCSRMFTDCYQRIDTLFFATQVEQMATARLVADPTSRAADAGS
jgi:hypothetical protein